ncbi:MAG TPA: SdrD B-like domain-containing protein [Pirellulales bacterium]|nr:SdrD B-like domain-containing protein [Pirellulales bacterium]
MGFKTTIDRWRQRFARRECSGGPHTSLWRRCQVEKLEPRQMMAADIQFGAVYFDPASGTDTVPNQFTVSFNGGAAGTQLTSVEINLDKNLNGTVDDGEGFFDTAASAPGVYGYTPFTLQSLTSGASITSVQVTDGGQQLIIGLSGFVTGDVLQFGIDVDEVGVDAHGNPAVSAVMEGAEFQGSWLSGTFTNPNYYTASGSNIFIDQFNSELAGTGLNLPPDDYEPPNPVDETVLTAGTMFPLTQTPLPSTIAGNVSVATDGAWNTPGVTKSPISGVTIDLYNSSNVLVGTTTTDPSGNYIFTALNPGTYHVVEVQPNGYLEGGDTVGSLAGTIGNVDELDGITVVANDHGTNYNFIEQLPVTISGHVQADTNGGYNTPGATHTPLAGVTLELVDPSGNPVLDSHGNAITTTTDADGNYSFTGLNPGTYGVREVQPAGYLEETDTVGTVNGSADGSIVNVDYLGGIALVSGQSGVQYNFYEQLPASIAGQVQLETFGNCVNPANTITQMAGVTVELVDASGNPVLDSHGNAITTTTDSNGRYAFTGLPLGTYGVHILVPTGYYQYTSSVGTVNGSTDGVDTSPIALDDAVLGSGQAGVNYNFVLLPPATLSGKVIYNIDGTCDPTTEPGVPNVTVDLLNSVGTIVAVTTTDSTGWYTFTGIAPGTYSVEEIVPNGYLEVASHPGCNGGDALNPHTITLVGINAGQTPTNYNFCLILPVSISGQVVAQTNGNCDNPQNTFTPLAGVTVTLVDGSGNPVLATNGQPITTVTDSNGDYTFSGLPPGAYGVHATVPSGYFTGYDSVGTVNGLVDGVATSSTALDDAALSSDQNGINYNFVLLPPANLSGKVIYNIDGTCDATTEPGVAGVTVDLLDSNGNVIKTTITDANGLYEFTGIAPGVYSVEEVVPAGYYAAASHVGCNGGDTYNAWTITLVGLNPGDNPVNYNFCLNPYSSITGYTYEDGPNITVIGAQSVTSLSQVDPSLLAGRTGVRAAGDTPLAGIVVTLADANGNPLLDANGNLIQTTTDSNGFYSFTGLKDGTYTVIEGGAAGYFQWINHAGSTGGTASYLGTTIVSIPLGIGQTSVENDFSFLQVTPFIFQPPSTPNPQVTPPVAYYSYYTYTPLGYQQINSPNPTNPPPGYSGSEGYTWHLSVVNAGLPRASSPDGDAIVQLISDRTEGDGWDAIDESTSRWKLRIDDDGEIGITEFVFGMGGATPIAGDYNGDGRTDVGVFMEGEWYVDLNGNGTWDKDDLWARLGERDDLPVTGDWDGDAKTDIAIYGRAWPGDPNAIRHEPGLPNPDNQRVADRERNVPPRPHHATHGMREMRRTSGGKVRSDVIDHVFYFGAPGDVPVAGNFNGSAIDVVGVFRNGQWHLDSDGDGRFGKGDIKFTMGQTGDVPVIGDFNGDGIDEIGVYRQGKWLIDINGDRVLDNKDMIVEFGGPNDRPVVGDWNGDGRDDMGVYSDGGNADAEVAQGDADAKSA